MVLSLALDRASIRRKDIDGRMHVALNPIAKANVCPYLGSEIPDYEALGLDPDKVYMLYRDPEELARGAHTFNNIQVLARHKPVNAEDPAKEIIVGSTGTDALWGEPYLLNTLVIWDQEGIDLIESEEAKEISPGYRYRADMTPGEYEGLHFDGVMRDIVGNHIALVPEGRQGRDVVVGDSQLEIAPVKLKNRTQLMMHGAISALVLPKLAQDAQVDLTGALKGIDKTNGKTKIPAVVAAITTLTKGKLAEDATLDGLAASVTLALDADKDDEEMAEDEDDEDKEDIAEDEDDPENGLTKPAMDAAIAAGVKSAVAKVEAIHEAKRDVEPVIGLVTVTQDSAASVYKLALDHMKVDLADVPPAAYRALFRSLAPKVGETQAAPTVALDAAGGLKSFNERFPEAVKLKGR